MLEIRFHGRGGQGTVVAAVLLARAFFKAGYDVQTFPVFGVERRGAPVEAYLRADDRKILVRSNLYAPDHVVVQDAKLLAAIDVTRGLKPRGWVLINSPGMPEVPEALKPFRLALLDATRIAVEFGLGTRTHPIINTAVIGGFARILGAPPLDAVKSAIAAEIHIKPEQNMQSAQAAYESVVAVQGALPDAPARNLKTGGEGA